MHGFITLSDATSYDKVYINLLDSDKGNLTTAYGTLDRNFPGKLPVTEIVAVSLFKEVS